MDIQEISLNEYEKIREKGTTVTTITGTKVHIVDGIPFTVVVGMEDKDTPALQSYEDQQNGEKEI